MLSMIKGFYPNFESDARYFFLLESPGRYLFLGDFEGLGQADHVFAGPQGIERLRLAAQSVLVVVGGLDGQADAPVSLVDLDDARVDFLADLEHVLDLVHAFLADLRDVHQAVDVVLQADERAEAGQLGDLAGDEVADLEAGIDVPSTGRRRAA